jgi:hypothetical protein
MRVKTGNGGVQNFLQHRGTAQCAVNKKKRQAQESIERTKENTMKWFQPRAPAIPPTVTAPALVNTALLAMSGTWIMIDSTHHNLGSRQHQLKPNQLNLTQFLQVLRYKIHQHQR